MGILIKTDAKSNIPLFRQIMEQIIDLIEARALAPDTRLPSSRSLAERLGVNRSTVYKAYQELWALGYLNSRPGSYSTIRQRPRVVSRETGTGRGLIDWREASTGSARNLYDRYTQEKPYMDVAPRPGTIDFIPLSPDSRLFPVDDFRKCMNHVLVTEGAKLLEYGSARGYRPLREFIASRMSQHSVSITADEILITTGAQNGIELLLQLLAPSGSGVAFEGPTYSRALDIFRLYDLKMIEIPMDENGMDLSALRRVIDRESPALVYTIPNFHNPTGLTTTQEHRESLLHICEQYRIPLVEDGFEEEMKYFGKAVLPIKSMDRRGVVTYLGTFSKVLFPGLRIGWIAAEKACIDRLVPIQRAAILSGNLLDQAALERFCRLGHYDLHIKRMHRIYRKRMQTAFKAMREALPAEWVDWTQPAGGYTIWIRLRHPRIDEAVLMANLADSGVRVLPGRFHYHGSPAGLNFRLSIGLLEETEIQEGIARLGEAIESTIGK